MKKQLFTTLCVTLCLTLTASAQRGALSNSLPAKTPPSTEPPPVSVAPPQPGAPQFYVYDQKPLGGRSQLVTPQQAQAIIDKFKAAYPKLGSPRLVIYVNRELVDENSGLRMIARTEKIDTTRTETKGADAASTTEKAAHENRYRLHEPKEPALADKQTVRDVERLFGRPFRMAGASLADQRVATQLMANQPSKSLATEGEQARKDREALSKIAEVAVEVLISSKNVSVAEVSGDKTYTVPDIQATAIRLSDSKIMGQASTSDILGKEGGAGYYARNFDVREITEATALALMEDLLTGIEAPAPKAEKP